MVNINKKSKLEKVHTVKWDRCVICIRSKGKVKSPEAVCTAKLGKGSFIKYSKNKLKGGKNGRK